MANSFDLTVEMGGLCVYDRKNGHMLAVDDSRHALYLFFEPRHVDDKNAAALNLKTSYPGYRYFRVEKGWRVVIPKSLSKPSPTGDDRDIDTALSVKALGFDRELQARPKLCGRIEGLVGGNKSIVGTYGVLAGKHYFPATDETLENEIGDQLFWRGRFETEVEVSVWAGRTEIGSVNLRTKSKSIPVKAACVGGRSLRPFHYAGQISQVVKGTYQPPQTLETAVDVGVMHAGSGSCPPTQFP